MADSPSAPTQNGRQPLRSHTKWRTAPSPPHKMADSPFAPTQNGGQPLCPHTKWRTAPLPPHKMARSPFAPTQNGGQPLCPHTKWRTASAPHKMADSPFAPTQNGGQPLCPHTKWQTAPLPPHKMEDSASAPTQNGGQPPPHTKKGGKLLSVRAWQKHMDQSWRVSEMLVDKENVSMGNKEEKEKHEPWRWRTNQNKEENCVRHGDCWSSTKYLKAIKITILTCELYNLNTYLEVSNEMYQTHSYFFF
ncbi:uncharacterized protein LOC135299828 [Passer domesticus]|uniref:uncharacterized protein LOC135299828 n=1 Tax=Passer domesticus TaxID=48849 RepID=UPI0030FEE937